MSQAVTVATRPRRRLESCTLAGASRLSCGSPPGSVNDVGWPHVRTDELWGFAESVLSSNNLNSQEAPMINVIKE